MRGINWKTLLFMIALGVVVFTIRGTGSRESSWQAAKVLYGFLGILIVVKVLWMFIRRSPNRETDE